MEVYVKLFGSLYALIGKRKLSLSVKHNCSVGELIAILIELYPRLSDLLSDGWRKDLESHLILLNKGEILTSEYLLEEGDEVTIVTPMSGG